MERTIETLKAELQRAQAQGYMIEHEEIHSPLANGVYSRHNNSYMGSEEAVSSLLHLKQSGGYQPRFARELEGVGLTEEAIDQLFNEFWSCYHPYLPFLNPAQTPDQYYQQHPLLFWVIIAVASRRYIKDPTLLGALSAPLTRLVWSTVADVPNTHYVVKALCLLCTWPLPTSTTSTDLSHILGGIMMKAATGIGLHRPNHTQDFSRVSIDLNREQLHDRVTTWAVCNIVAQNLGTGYGQPASTLYDWTLAVRSGDEGPFKLSPELEALLQIQIFCDKVSKEMYSNASDPRGVAGDATRATLTRVFRRDFSALQADILSRKDLSPLVNLHLRAAGLHFRLSAFFDSSTTPGYMDDLMALWRAATSFLTVVFELEDTPLTSMHGRSPLRYATNYILQMIIAACFTLLKHLSSFFAAQIDFDQGRQLFHRTISIIRSMSVINNDLPWRLAELMVQMYNGSRLETRNSLAQQHQLGDNDIGAEPPLIIDDSLQLKVRCRMSMSLVFDSIWRWREEYQAHGRGNLEGQREQLEKLLISFPPEDFIPTHESEYFSVKLFWALFSPRPIEENVIFYETTRLRDEEELFGNDNWPYAAATANDSPSSMMGKLGLSSSKKVSSRHYEAQRPRYTAVGGVGSSSQRKFSSKKGKSRNWMMSLPPPALNYDGNYSPKGKGKSPVRMMNYPAPAFAKDQRRNSSKGKGKLPDRTRASLKLNHEQARISCKGKGKLPDSTATKSAFSIVSQDDMAVFSENATPFFTPPESPFCIDDNSSAACTPQEQDVHSPFASDSYFDLPAPARSHCFAQPVYFNKDHLFYKHNSSYKNNTVSNTSHTAAMNKPTNPESAAESSASSTHHMDATLMPPSQHQLSNQLLAAQSGAGSVTPNHGLPSAGMLGFGESNYEVFDPLNWMLDGLVDFPYSYAAVQGLEANGLG